MEFTEIQLELKKLQERRIQLSVLKEQAIAKCNEIEQKYGITNEEELKQLLDKAQVEYNNKLSEAVTYIEKAKEAMKPYEGLV